MMISTKGRYALRVMVDLAEHREEGYIPLRTVAQRQGISQKYLESIMTTLSKAGFVDGTHGRGGGCRCRRRNTASGRCCGPSRGRWPRCSAWRTRRSPAKWRGHAARGHCGRGWIR